MNIATHVTDTAQGCPAANLEVSLAYLQDNGKWLDLGTGPTDEAGTIAKLLPRSFPLKAGIYRLSYSSSHYFEFSGMAGVFPVVPVVFEVGEMAEYVVRLALSRWGFSAEISR